MNAVKRAELAVTDRDQQDALRVVECTAVLAAMPGMMSPAAREIAAVRLRELSVHHPCAADIFDTIVARLESYG